MQVTWLCSFPENIAHVFFSHWHFSSLLMWLNLLSKNTRFSSTPHNFHDIEANMFFTLNIEYEIAFK